MTEAELLKRYPRVWHMAADGLWPSIQKHGLLSVSALLDLHGLEGADRDPIESARRPQCVTLSHPVHGTAIIRDNKPLLDSKLTKCLEDGLRPVDWYRILNGKSFFWVTRNRLATLMGVKDYAKDPQLVLEVDTAKLVDRHRERIRLARINTGQTIYSGSPRGLSTFMTIEQFPDEGNGKVGGKKRPEVAELVVEGGVPDIVECLTRVDRVVAGKWSQIWP